MHLGSAHEKFGVWIKVVPKAKFPAEPGGKNGCSVPNSNSLFLTDSHAEIYMYLIQGIRFGSWKVRRLNWALQNDLSSRKRATNFEEASPEKLDK